MFKLDWKFNGKSVRPGQLASELTKAIKGRGAQRGHEDRRRCALSDAREAPDRHPRSRRRRPAPISVRGVLRSSDRGSRKIASINSGGDPF